jgi:hypothetical protein
VIEVPCLDPIFNHADSPLAQSEFDIVDH